MTSIPGEYPIAPELGGYELAISMDILRGRYRDDPANPTPIPANKVIAYALKLPEVNHKFLKGHRIMVQIQSSWFPLYDRNPQVFVPNIFNAKKVGLCEGGPKNTHIFEICEQDRSADHSLKYSRYI